MNTQVKKTVQANYSQELIAVVVAEYQSLIVAHKGDNKAVLQMLAEKHGKTIPSLRAKLASLKVYVSDKKSDEKTPAKGNDLMKYKKEEIASLIGDIIGQSLEGLEIAPKNTLLTLLLFLLKTNKLIQEKEDKINSLIQDMLANDEPIINDDVNDND